MPVPPRPEIPKLAELDLVIETPRLRLRPFVEADAEAIFPVASQPDFPRHMSWAAHQHLDETRAFVHSQIDAVARNAGVCWAITRDDGLIGAVGFDHIRWQLHALRVDRSELGYWLAPSAWSQGLMTEAAGAVVRFGFEIIGLHKITVSCFAENHASRRVIEKLGFRFLARAEEDIWRDGAWHDHLLYELTASEWSDVHTTRRVARPRP